MQYTINNSIIFNSGDGTLQHLETNDVVQLPLPAQRLLQIILESECEILTRDFLFREVWDKYGLTGSNSNLNQYLSLLRRSMLAFGCDNFVITIPKIGIKLDEQIGIVKTSAQNEPVQRVEHSAPEPAKKNPRGLFAYPLLPLGAGLAVLIMATLAGLWILKARNTERDPTFTAHTLQTGCVIHTVKSEREYYNEKVENQVAKILQENNLSCTKGFNLYFDYYPSSTPQTYGRTMLSLCRTGSEGVNLSCDNIFYSNRNEIND
ncbi:DNA-binding winged helix-turn-helix (wHTH) protein [Enterobacter sp. BIGb0383]|uniref:winged helix-turn-helix domain-containing protein n=1 Tax=unclassified Enterobacter TaxID=2608935 RepID=UPI000F48F391|nr:MULTISPECIES: hypothetical protein [unclassified Enterobacter]ROP59347.1 DNA-binding winged helix-turn-helix (wHTH) protein [Enterobacter sp. BIGb0383]ROS09187.1 DNA-binding winged helix-turn-helix (wHTH) protein [Enterobacter sp. BIGb0359]